MKEQIVYIGIDATGIKIVYIGIDATGLQNGIL
jgi:hypothetical protein